MKTGIELIAEERKRQIEKEGYTLQDDVTKYNKEIGTENHLVFAAVAYALPDKLSTKWQKDNIVHRSNFFPWDKEFWKPSTDNRIKELQKAGALISAEIDRLLKIK